MKRMQAAFAVALIVAVGAQYVVIRESRRQSDSVRAAADEMMRMAKEMAEPQTLETSWTDERNAKHTVRTPRSPGEGMNDWTERHQQAVDALQAIYPPAP